MPAEKRSDAISGTLKCSRSCTVLSMVSSCLESHSNGDGGLEGGAGVSSGEPVVAKESASVEGWLLAKMRFGNGNGCRKRVQFGVNSKDGISDNENAEKMDCEKAVAGENLKSGSLLRKLWYVSTRFGQVPEGPARLRGRVLKLENFPVI